jgi:hypothetical protein
LRNGASDADKKDWDCLVAARKSPRRRKSRSAGERALRYPGGPAYFAYLAAAGARSFAAAQDDSATGKADEHMSRWTDEPMVQLPITNRQSQI